jgi:hypothetical protein
MHRRQVCWPLIAILALLIPLSARADQPAAPLFRPDPKSVQRYGPAYRYPQAGWIVLHIEGEPYERGYQHGRLLASEIAAHLRCFALMQSPKAPSETWRTMRTLANALFLRRYAPEFVEEMKGIADGAAAAGARFDDRPVDLIDIVTLNGWSEFDTLESALEVTPNGLEGKRFPRPQPEAKPPPKPMHCSAFAATGPATADGKIVFGHITMFPLYPSNFYNVWIDVKPAKGHRVLMQSYPGGMQSGMDYYYNDAGLLVCETTIAQTPFNIQGHTEASRIREAVQYADSIDKAVDILQKSNNGLYTNEWLLADIKTNEIAMFELGTHKSRLWRSSKNEWYGDTPGFYWGCNNVKDLDVRLETAASLKDRPANMVFRPSDRDTAWQRLYDKHKGKIGVAFAREAFSMAPIAAYHSADAKFTTTDLARELKTWALFGPPLGRTWHPTQDERQQYPDIKPLISNPWTILHPEPLAKDAGKDRVADISDRVEDRDEDEPPADEEGDIRRSPAWRGTLLPKTDGDIWLATAFADYEHMVAPDRARRSRGRDALPLEVFGRRSSYLAVARASTDTPLAQTRAENRSNDWYRVASGKGVCLLHELRRLMGEKQFAAALDSFGRAHAGKEVTTAEFRAHVEKESGSPLEGFFDFWLRQPGLPPALRLEKPACVPMEGQNGASEWQVTGKLRRDGAAPPTLIDVTVETDEDDVTRSVGLVGQEASFTITTTAHPKRIVVDKHNRSVKTNGSAYTVNSFSTELDKTLIVYGTAYEELTNREAAETLQRGIRERGSNYAVPFKADRAVTDEELRNHHLLLIGRPDSNTLVDRFRPGLPVSFGQRSVRVGKDDYANAGSAVVVAVENPLNRRFSIVVIAGLSAEATWHAPRRFVHQGRPAEVLVLPNQAGAKAVVLPPPELVWDFAEVSASRQSR